MLARILVYLMMMMMMCQIRLARRDFDAIHKSLDDSKYLAHTCFSNQSSPGFQPVPNKKNIPKHNFFRRFTKTDDASAYHIKQYSQRSKRFCFFFFSIHHSSDSNGLGKRAQQTVESDKIIK